MSVAGPRLGWTWRRSNDHHRQDDDQDDDDYGQDENKLWRLWECCHRSPWSPVLGAGHDGTWWWEMMGPKCQRGLRLAFSVETKRATKKTPGLGVAGGQGGQRGGLQWQWELSRLWGRCAPGGSPSAPVLIPVNILVLVDHVHQGVSKGVSMGTRGVARVSPLQPAPICMSLSHLACMHILHLQICILPLRCTVSRCIAVHCQVSWPKGGGGHQQQERQPGSRIPFLSSLLLSSSALL